MVTAIRSSQRTKCINRKKISSISVHAMDEQQSIYTVSTEKCVFYKILCHYRGNTALKSTIPAVLPQPLSPLPWYYRSSGFHHRGKSAVTAVLPSSPLPCRSLLWTLPGSKKPGINDCYPVLLWSVQLYSCTIASKQNLWRLLQRVFYCSPDFMLIRFRFFKFLLLTLTMISF